ELSIMVGASDAVFAHVRPILETMGTDVTHCGPVGCGQVVKILNNMLVFQHCAALSEAIAFGRRNHGMKAMLPREFPLRAFSTRYAIKDLSYALEMAEASGLDMKAAELTMERLKQTEAAGFGDEYHPVVLNVIDPL